MQVYTKDITVDDSHKYYHKNIGSVSSVTTILNKKNKENLSTKVLSYAELGTHVHNILEGYINNKYSQTDIEDKSQELLNDPYRKKLYEIINFIDKNNLKGKAEQKFIAKEDNISFGGTADFLTEELCIDFKTGDMKENYKAQIATYSKAFKKNEGVIIYFDNKNTLQTLNIDNKDIEDKYNFFLSKARVYSNILNANDLELKKRLDALSEKKKLIEELTKQLQQQKQEITQEITNKGYSKYAVDKYLIYQVKDKTTTTLKEHYKSEILKQHPAWFDIKSSKGYCTIRGL